MDGKVSTLLQAKREDILLLAARHGASNVRIFGSVARGDATSESDVDVLVDLQPGRSLFDLGAFLEDLKVLLGRPVDVVTEKGLRAASDTVFFKKRFRYEKLGPAVGQHFFIFPELGPSAGSPLLGWQLYCHPKFTGAAVGPQLFIFPELGPSAGSWGRCRQFPRTRLCNWAAPTGRQFAQPWASPRDFRKPPPMMAGPTGQRFAPKNGWPVGPVCESWRLVPLGVAQGLANGRAFGPTITTINRDDRCRRIVKVEAASRRFLPTCRPRSVKTTRRDAASTGP